MIYKEIVDPGQSLATPGVFTSIVMVQCHSGTHAETSYIAQEGTFLVPDNGAVEATELNIEYLDAKGGLSA